MSRTTPSTPPSDPTSGVQVTTHSMGFPRRSFAAIERDARSRLPSRHALSVSPRAPDPETDVEIEEGALPHFVLTDPPQLGRLLIPDLDAEVAVEDRNAAAYAAENAVEHRVHAIQTPCVGVATAR